MTPLKPLVNTTGVRGVMADRYPINDVCAHPECDKPTESAHHIFGRPPGPHSSSWFVEIRPDLPIPINDAEMMVARDATKVIPHAIGLCGSGTTDHHGDLEEHRSWIKFEEGEFIWYDRTPPIGVQSKHNWNPLGPLDPQPAGRHKAGKPKRKRFKGEERKKRRTISIAVPAEAQEDGGEVWDDLLGDGKDDRPYGRVRRRLDALGVDGERSPYYVIVDALNDWLNG